MLTKSQRALHLFLDTTIRDGGVTPSYDEMREHLGLKSKSGIHRLVLALEERGFIRRLPNRARAIDVIRSPDATTPPPARVKPGSETVEIPLMGRIAAGTPIQAIQARTGSVRLPPDMVGPGEHFALKVVGDSMIEAGIFDGDTVVIRKQNSARTGDIVVALIDGHEATLKRLRRVAEKIHIEAANPAYETQVHPVAKVRIQGRLAQLIRQY